MVHSTERVEQAHIYLEDTYRYDLRTEVIATGERDGDAWVAVRGNIYHPQGGGQPADVGWLNDVPVKPWRDHETGLVVVSGSDPGQPLPDLAVGDSVSASIDQMVRLRHAALHTAGHLIEALVQPRHWRTVGNNHFPGQARVEFTAEQMTGLETPEDRATATGELRRDLAAAIKAGLRMTAQIDAKGNRTVTVGALHTVPCGGTHVASLAELDGLELPDIRVKKGRIKASYMVEHRKND